MKGLMRFEAEKAESKYSKKPNSMETEWSLFHDLCSFFNPDSPPWRSPNLQWGSLCNSGREDRCDTRQLFGSAWKNI